MSAYGAMKKRDRPRLDYLPARLTDTLTLRYVDKTSAEDRDFCRQLLNAEIERGISYPFDESMDEAAFDAYFLSDDAFVAVDAASGERLAAFYVKPNYPGRSSHICNGGFLVAPAARRRGIARALGGAFPYLARDLGFESSMFNLVYTANVPSVRLWQSMPELYKQTGLVRDAGRIRLEVEVRDDAGGVRSELQERLSDAMQFQCHFASALADRAPPSWWRPLGGGGGDGSKVKRKE